MARTTAVMERQPLTVVVPVVHGADRTVVRVVTRAKADHKTVALMDPATLVAPAVPETPAVPAIPEEVADRGVDQGTLATVAATVVADQVIDRAEAATITTVVGETTIAADRETITVATEWSNQSNSTTQN